MNVGVIGSGSIGPDLAYGFATALGKAGGGKVYLVDIQQEALDAGMARIKGYVDKAVGKGKLKPAKAEALLSAFVPTLELGDLADCDYVLEAATEELELKQKILAQVEEYVSERCLIGFATSGLPRARIASSARHPERCFVNHPFFPAWRSTPVEVVASDDPALTRQMVKTLQLLGKVPIPVADVVCFAADDIFGCYCAEAARIVAEGTATPAQVDAIVNDAIGGGGPFRVMDLTRGNLLNVHCLDLMAQEYGDWFKPPAIFTEQGLTPWHDPDNPGDPAHDDALKKEVLDRILAVLIARAHFVVDNDICPAGALNWMSRMALGFNKGLLDLAADMGADAAHDLCAAYAARFDGFEVPASIADRQLPDFFRTIVVEKADAIATLTVCRPEAMNALSDMVMDELSRALDDLKADDNIKGVVLTAFNGALAGADIKELARLETFEAARDKCYGGQGVTLKVANLGKPVVAAVNGPVLGGGCELVMGAWARVAGPKTMVGQPEVNLGIIPGYGGTQRLPRIIGFERANELLRNGMPIFAKEACALGWAEGEPVDDPVVTATELVQKHLAGEITLAPLDTAPMALPDPIPEVDIGYHSAAVDAVLVAVMAEGLVKDLEQGLRDEAKAFAACRDLEDFSIGMKNFIENGPRVKAAFIHK